MASRRLTTTIFVEVNFSDSTKSTYTADLDIYDGDEVDTPEITCIVSEGDISETMGVEWNDVVIDGIDEYLCEREVNEERVSFSFSEDTQLLTRTGETALKKLGKIKK